jgi:thymidylate synthase ThyX
LAADNYRLLDYADPFSTYRFTRLIHLTSQNGFTGIEKAAMLSRYSRSTKSMIDLIETEFQDKNRGPEFIKKLLSEYGDDSIAELNSEQIGVEGISILAASKLTDRRIGVSFLEKSTRYVPYSPDSFYIPDAVYEMGMVDEFKDLCGLSYKTFNFLYNDLLSLLEEKYPIKTCMFYDSKRERDVPFESLTLESDIKNAEKAYKRSLKDRSFDNAGYSWLTSLKTNIGFNANARSLEYSLKCMQNSDLIELNNLSFNLYDLLSQTIEPFISRVNPNVSLPNLSKMFNDSINPFDTYNGKSSIISLYKHNIVSLMRSYEQFSSDMIMDNSEEMEHEDIKKNNGDKPDITKHIKQNANLIKNILSEIGLTSSQGNKISLKDSNIPNTVTKIDPGCFKPSVDIISYMNEQHCIDMLCSAIMFEHNENLLEYDEINSNNIDDNLRIKPIDASKIKAGILFDIINGNKILDDFNHVETKVNKTTENTLCFNDINGYWEDNNEIKDSPIYQDYLDRNKSTINKEQDYLIRRYTGDRKSRRDKLGRAFEFIDYTFEVSSSFRIMREFKRHRLASSLYPQVITARNSFDSFIFPNLFIQNQHLFDEYKYLIEKSFDLYSKFIKKSEGDYITAQYILPLGVRSNYITKMNFRELEYMLSLRTTPQAHEELRHICQGIYNLLLIIHPNLMKICKFVDLDDYSLGRLKANNLKEYKMSSLG